MASNIISGCIAVPKLNSTDCFYSSLPQNVLFNAKLFKPRNEETFIQNFEE